MVWKSADLTLDYLLRLNEDRISGIHSETSQNVKPTDIESPKRRAAGSISKEQGDPRLDVDFVDGSEDSGYAEGDAVDSISLSECNETV